MSTFRFVLLCVLCASVANSQPAFTLEQVLSAPFPSDLRAAPSGRRVAWTFDDRGRRNVWVAEAPEFKPRQLTSFAVDDGQELSDLAWSPDGRTLVYVRGGPKNQAGEIPNPTSDPGGAEQALWAAGVEGGMPRRLGMGRSPSVSPRGDQVAFVYENQIWVGYLTAMALARNSDLFAAGVDLHGVHDWSTLRNFGALPEGASEQARASSPISSVKTWRSPVLFIHGDDDRNVPFSQTVNLVAKLREQNVSFEQLIFPDEIHDFLLHGRWLEAYHAAEKFFDANLKSNRR